MTSPAPISVARARELVSDAATRLAAESINVEQALGRVLAQDVLAPGPIPPFTASAMDGYAVVGGRAERTLRVIGESRAGHPAAVTVGRGEAVRISTGARIPDGATAVVRQEDTEVLLDGTVRLLDEASPDRNIRRAGEDMQAGQHVLAAGTTLGMAELGAAVAAGFAELAVIRRPRVGILCTGDELRAPGAPLGPGEIHNSNAVMLVALAAAAGGEVETAVRVADERAATERDLARALSAADVVIVSGGVSVGPHDHVKPALAALGVRETFWRVALQPGKPTWFGERDGRLVFGLPGNPVSAVVTFVLFVRPALYRLGGRPPAGSSPAARLGQSVRRNRDREQAIRVRIRETDDGIEAIPTGPQGSHLVTSLLGAQALALIPAGDGEEPAGASVALEPL